MLTYSKKMYFRITENDCYVMCLLFNGNFPAPQLPEFYRFFFTGFFFYSVAQEGMLLL